MLELYDQFPAVQYDKYWPLAGDLTGPDGRRRMRPNRATRSLEEAAMARIRHIAIATQDPEATARFYIEGLGLQEVGRVDSATAEGYYLSDGHVNLAILRF